MNNCIWSLGDVKHEAPLSEHRSLTLIVIRLFETSGYQSSIINYLVQPPFVWQSIEMMPMLRFVILDHGNNNIVANQRILLSFPSNYL